MTFFSCSLLKGKGKDPVTSIPKDTLAALVVKPPAKKQQQQKKNKSMPKLPPKTNEQHLSDYAEFMIEAWEDSDCELGEADFDDINLGDDDLGMADEIVENTRGTVLKYDLRRNTSHNVVHVGGGDIGSVSGEFEQEGTPEQIKQWLAEVEEINREILFDAENSDLFDVEDSDEDDDEGDEPPAPVVTLDPQGVRDQFARLGAQDYGMDAGCWISDESFLAERSPSPSQPKTLSFGELANGDELDLFASLLNEVYEVLDDEPSDAGGDEVDETALEYARPRRLPSQLIPMSEGMSLLLNELKEEDKVSTTGKICSDDEESAFVNDLGEEDLETVPLAPVPDVEEGVPLNSAPAVEFLPGIDHLTNLEVCPMWIKFDRDLQEESACLLDQNAYSEDLQTQESDDCDIEFDEDADFTADAPVQPVTIFDSDTSQQVRYSALNPLLWTYDKLEDDQEESSESYLFTFCDDSEDSDGESEVGDQEEDLYQLSLLTYFDVDKQQDIGYIALNQLLEDPFADFSGIHRLDDRVDLEDFPWIEETDDKAEIWPSSCSEAPIDFTGKQYSLKGLSHRRSCFLDDEFDTIGLDSRAV